VVYAEDVTRWIDGRGAYPTWLRHTLTRGEGVVFSSETVGFRSKLLRQLSNTALEDAADCAGGERRLGGVKGAHQVRAVLGTLPLPSSHRPSSPLQHWSTDIHDRPRIGGRCRDKMDT
jgi:hypothetical protein